MKRSTPLKRVPLRPGTSGLRRSSELSRGPKRMKRGTPLRAKGGSRFPKRRQRWYTDWIKLFPCVVGDKFGGWTGFITEAHRCWGPIDPAHVNHTRAQGAPDLGEVVPLCRKHHREQEGRTAWFNTRYGVDLAALASDLASRAPVVSAPPAEHR